MSNPIKHHFIPQFHLRKWSEADGKIPFAMRKDDGSILHDRVAPSATAFENRLYSYLKVPEANRQAVEKLFFAHEVDDRAAPILEKIISLGISSLTEQEKTDWARYLIAARLRIPEIVNNLKETAGGELRQKLLENPDEFEEAKRSVPGATIPDKTLAEWVERRYVGLIDNFGMMILPGIINNKEHLEKILALNWWTMDFTQSTCSLLISDRPLWVSSGLDHPNCLLAIPLSPTCAFFASRNPAIKTAFAKQGPSKVARRFNESMSTQYARFVYGRCQTNFLDRRMPFRAAIKTPTTQKLALGSTKDD